MKYLNLTISALLLSFASFSQIAPITGPSTVCEESIPLSDATSGGTWSSSAITVAPISVAAVVTGVSAGVTTITYTVGASYVTHSVTVDPLPSVIAGVPLICGSGPGTFSAAPGGGTWSCSNPAIATISMTSGVVTGVSYGTADITYTIPTGCATGITVTVAPAPAAYSITGGGNYCAGGAGVVVGLGGSSSGISYQLYNGVATMGAPVPGTGAAISFGAETAPGTYTVEASAGSGCSSTMTGTAVIVVSPLPTAFTVTGGGAYCSGGTGVPIGLSSTAAGINYQLFNGGVAVGSPVGGTGSPVSFGVVTMPGTYTIVATDASTGCTNTMTGSATVTVNPLPNTYSIAGGGSYCAGGAGADVTLSNSDLGISYQLYVGTTPVGTSAAGTGGPLDFGMQTAAGSYTAVATDATTGCTNNMTGSATITINPLPTVTATATPASCGGVVTLAAGGAVSYSWGPSTGLSCSACASATLLPTATTTYSVIGTDGSGCVNVATVSVDGNSISGYITYTATPSAGDLKIWLIQFNPSDSVITATDSTVNCVDGGMAYYQFMDEPSGSYMVKADLLSSVAGTSGYIPTYSLSTPHWDSAATVSHSGAADTLHINMVYGTVPSGPGFISGYVVSGAGRGTSTGIPAVGMLIYLKDASGHIITYKYTASDGSYSFGSLANGSYIINPEDYKYYTTASAVITLAPGSETASAVNFKQHTTYGTITPYNTTMVNQLTAPQNGISIYPNPTTGNLNIQWNQGAGNADFVITDVVGREVFKSGINLNATTGQTQINIKDLKDGIYFIALRNDKVYYSGKFVKQQ